MKIEFNKTADGKNYTMNAVGRLDEFEIIVNALENSINESRSMTEVTKFLRKKLNESKR